MNENQVIPQMQLIQQRGVLFLRQMHPQWAWRRPMQIPIGAEVPTMVQELLLPLMNQCRGGSRTGLFYGGSCHRPFCFLFEISRELFSLAAAPCTVGQWERRFVSCAAPELSGLSYTAVILHRADGVYRAAGLSGQSTAERHLVRQCVRIAGADFPELCFRRGPVYFLRGRRQRDHIRYDKIYWMPLCADTRQTLLLSHTIRPEEVLDELCSPAADRFSVTRREGQALVLAREGLTNRAIAGMMGIQEGTVKKLLADAYAKTGISSRYDLLR